ncbi:MAG: hypothetical protein AB7O68_08180 [Pirellulales bacterium]
MRYAVAILCLCASTTFAQDFQPLIDDEAPPAGPQVVTVGPPIRCAYHGRWGTFHLTGPTGTAGYTFKGVKWVANLGFVREDGSFYYYRQSASGDPTIQLFAFSKSKGADGRYPVWRRTPGGWRIYECTERWGEFRTGEVRVSLSDEARFDAINEALRLHDERISELERAKQRP